MSWNVKETIARALDEGRDSVDANEEERYVEMADGIMASLTMFEDLVEAREKNRERFSRE